jgi:hypothetical protein
MAFDFNVNSPAFKGASFTPLAASTNGASGPNAAEDASGVSGGGLVSSLPTAQNTPDQKVRVTGQFAQFAHGAGCGHCTAGIASKVFEGKPAEVKSMMAAAATQAHSQNKARIREDVVRHEGIHHSRATGNSLLKVGSPQINDDVIEKVANGQGGGTLGSVAIEPPAKNAKTAKEARDIAEAYKTMAYAANAGAGDASGADKGVAQTGEAGAAEMTAKAQQLDEKEKQSGGDAQASTRPSAASGGDNDPKRAKTPGLSLSA